MDVHHQVTSRSILHNKTHMLRSLEAGEQVDQERMVRHIHNLKDALLTHKTTERRVNERQGGKQRDGGRGHIG